MECRWCAIEDVRDVCHEPENDNQRFQLSVCSSGRRREEGRDQRGGLIQSSQVEIVATNSDTTI